MVNLQNLKMSPCSIGQFYHICLPYSEILVVRRKLIYSPKIVFIKYRLILKMVNVLCTRYLDQSKQIKKFPCCFTTDIYLILVVRSVVDKFAALGLKF